jgi:hypothetical protein
MGECDDVHNRACLTSTSLRFCLHLAHCTHDSPCAYLQSPPCTRSSSSRTPEKVRLVIRVPVCIFIMYVYVCCVCVWYGMVWYVYGMVWYAMLCMLRSRVPHLSLSHVVMHRMHPASFLSDAVCHQEQSAIRCLYLPGCVPVSHGGRVARAVRSAPERNNRRTAEPRASLSAGLRLRAGITGGIASCLFVPVGGAPASNSAFVL